MHPRPRLILPRAASCSIPTTRPSLRLAVCVCSLARACLFAQPTSEDAHHPSQPRNLVNFVRMGGGRQPRHDPCAPATAHRSEEGPAEVTAARTDAAVPVRAGARSIHGVPRRRPSRDSLTLLPERAAACPLTVRRVWRSVVEGWAEDFSRHGAVDHGRCPMNAHGQARRWRLLPRAHSGLAHEFARRARASCLRTRASG